MQWDDEWLKYLVQQLQDCKDRCQRQQRPDVWYTLLGCADCRVYRVGVNRGGGRGTHYPFRISYNGITIGLGDWNASQNGRANVLVQLTGRDCLLYGAWQAYEQVRELIELFSGEVLDEKLTRADFCLDIAGLSVREFQKPLRRRQFITRFRTLEPKENLVTNDWLGFAAGKNPQRVIWYDKLKEQADSVDKLYLDALTARRYGGTLPSSAARLEVQLSRPWLIRQGITSPADLRRLGSLAVQKVLSKSLRLTADRVDAKHKNHQRAKLHPLWAALQTAAMDVFGQPEGTLAPLDRSRIAPDRLSKQGRGCLENSLHQRAIECATYGEFVAAVGNELLRIAPTAEAQEQFMQNFRRKRTEFAP